MTRKLAPISPSGSTILLADDDPEYLEATRRLLEREGHQVLCATDGPTALATLRERPVDLLLLDYFMPGMTGEEVVAQLRQFDAAVQVILQTGYASERPPREMLRRLDIQGYFDKSEGPDKLLLWTEAGLKAARNIQQLNQSEAKSRRWAEQLTTLYAASLDIIAPQDLSTLLQTLVERAARLLQACGSDLYLCDLAQDEVRRVVTSNNPEAGPGLVLKYGEGIVGRVAQSGKPLIVDDSHIQPNDGTARLAVPMIWQGRVIGVIDVVDEGERRHFTTADEELLTLFANQAAIAIENVRLHEAVKTQRVEEQAILLRLSQALLKETEAQAVMEMAVRVTAEALRAPVAGLMLPDRLPDPTHLILRASVGAPSAQIGALRLSLGQDSASGYAFSRGEPLVIEDFNAETRFQTNSLHRQLGVSAGLVAPMIARGKAIGTLSVADYAPRRFSADNLRLLELIANVTAQALERAQLFDAEREQRELAQALREIGEMLSATLDFDAVLDLLLEQVARVVPYDSANVMLVEDNQARIARMRGYEQFGEGVAYSISTLSFEIEATPNLRWIAETHRPLIIPDKAADPDWIQVDASAHARSGSWAGVPIVVQNQVVAFLAVDKVEPNFYRPEHAERLATFAAQATLAWQNARLYQQSQQQLAELSLLFEVSHDIQRADHVEASLPLILDRVLQVMRANAGTLLLRDGIADQLRVAATRGYPAPADDLVIPFGQGLAGGVMLTGEALVSEDLATDARLLRPELFANLHAGVAVPLATRETLIGAVLIAYADYRPITASQIQLLTTVATTAASGLHQAQLFEAVQRAEQRYRELFEEAPVMYVITRHREGSPAVVNCNELFLTTLGYTRAEVVGRPLADFYAPEARAKMIEGGYQRALQGEFLSEERELVARDGRMVEVLLRAIPEVARDGHVTGTRAMFVDITERKRSEEALEQRLRETLLLNRVIAATTSTLEPTTVLQTVCQELAHAFDVPQSAAALLDADRTHLTVVAEYCADGRPSALGAVISVANNPATQYVLERRLPLTLTDVGTDLRMEAIRDLMKMRGTVSLLIVPLVIRDQVVGTLGLDALEQREFSPEAIALAQNVAAATSTALENARLFAAAERRLKHMQALRSIDTAITASLDLHLTLNVLLDQATAQLRVDATDILLLGPHSQRLEYAAGRGFRTPALQHTRLRLGESYAGRAAVEQRIIHIADLRHRHTDFLRSPLFAQEALVTYYGVPLIAKGQVVGVLEIFHRAPLDPDPEWLDFLAALAVQAAIAIDNAALFERLQRSNAELAVAYDATIEGWSRALDLRDKETEGHTRRVTEMTERLTRAMGMSEEELVHVRRGALLHDIGKMGIPDGMLLKPGPLTDEERAIMRQHPVYAYEMLSPIVFLRPALDIPYCHHEKWDGTGYPRGLKGEQIPQAARIFAVVDVWDALCSDRPYRPAWREEKAREYIREQAGKHFDPQVVEAFLKLLESRHSARET
ncbi:MAG TPA: GAF domain-containing protein [Anaerolineales bacterium]|nr:GAF domain-containing protein [Anaerolineales bacterium]